MPASILKGMEEHAIAVMRAGELLGKYGRQGTMKQRHFCLSEDLQHIQYKGKGFTSIPLASVTQLSSGRDSAVFRSKDGDMFCTQKVKYAQLCAVSFTLHYEEPDGSYRTLDLQCLGSAAHGRKPSDQFVLWFHGLGYLASRAHAAPRMQINKIHGGTGPTIAPAEGSSKELSRSSASVREAPQDVIPPPLPAPTPAWAPPLASAYVPAPAPGLSAARKLQSHRVAADDSSGRDNWGADVASASDWANSQATSEPSERTTPMSPAVAPQTLNLSKTSSGNSRNWGRSISRLYSAGSTPAPGGPTSAAAVFVAGPAAPPGGSDSRAGLATVPGSDKLQIVAAATGSKQTVMLSDSGVVYSVGAAGDDERIPAQVSGFDGYSVRAVACSQGATLALALGGKLLTWGKSASGALGVAGAVSHFLPTLLQSFHVNDTVEREMSFTAIAAGPFHCAAISEGGQLFTWGDSAHGRLGHGSAWAAVPEPRLVTALQQRKVLAVACGFYHTAAVCTDLAAAAFSSGRAASEPRFLYTWGASFEAADSQGGRLVSSNEGCLGHAGLQPHEGSLVPRAVELGDVRSVACGLNVTVAVDGDGSVWQMGAMLRTGALRGAEWEAARTPTRVRGALDSMRVTSVSVGRAHAIASAGADSGAAPVTWGDNMHGQLGRGPATPAAAADGTLNIDEDVLLEWATPAAVASQRCTAVRSVCAGADNTVVCVGGSTAAPPMRGDALSRGPRYAYLASGPPPAFRHADAAPTVGSSDGTQSIAASISSQQPMHRPGLRTVPPAGDNPAVSAEVPAQASEQGTEELKARLAQLERIVLERDRDTSAPKGVAPQQLERDASALSDGSSSFFAQNVPVHNGSMVSSGDAARPPYPGNWGAPLEITISHSEPGSPVAGVASHPAAHSQETVTIGNSGDSPTRLAAEAAAAQRQIAELKSQLAEEKAARKAAEARALELRLRLAEQRGGGSNGGSGGDKVERYASLTQKNPVMVDSFWVPVDTGVHARLDVAEYALLAKLKFSSKLFDKDGVKEWYDRNGQRVSVGTLIDTLDGLGAGHASAAATASRDAASRGAGTQSQTRDNSAAPAVAGRSSSNGQEVLAPLANAQSSGRALDTAHVVEQGVAGTASQDRHALKPGSVLAAPERGAGLSLQGSTHGSSSRHGAGSQASGRRV